MTQQRRRVSLLEAWLNIGIGFGVSFLANLLILPLYGMPFKVSAFLEIGALFTVISVIRSYYVRRLFVWLHDKGVLK
jgi:hypothetical protein